MRIAKREAAGQGPLELRNADGARRAIAGCGGERLAVRASARRIPAHPNPASGDLEVLREQVGANSAFYAGIVVYPRHGCLQEDKILRDRARDKGPPSAI
jgi:hypothetical protein